MAIKDTVETLVIGSGFSGIGLAVSFKQAGFTDFLVLEEKEELGGTWRDNAYPGAACDVPSHLYSFSFAPNPNWSRSFSGQQEIFDYMLSVADEHAIRHWMRFGTTVTKMTWIEHDNQWEVDTTQGTYRSTYMIVAAGALCAPRLPDIEGIEDFQGEIMHSARWDDSINLRGKKVAVIGTGASAIQIIPSIVDEVASLDVYQRTAPYVLPRIDRPYSTGERAVFRNLPVTQKIARAGIYVGRETQVAGFGGNSLAMLPMKTLFKAHLAAKVRDSELREKLTPNYEIGCKRVLLSNKYYPAIASEHVELVTDPIRSINADSVVTGDGEEHPCDVLIVCTGFHVTDAPIFDVTFGLEERSLGQRWREEGISAYKGTTVSGFPNMFTMTGPNTGLGHTSMVYMIESQINYILSAMQWMRKNDVQTVDVRQDVQETYADEMDRRLEESVWLKGGCSSWYLDSVGRAAVLWPGHTYWYRDQTRHFDHASYHAN